MLNILMKRRLNVTERCAAGLPLGIKVFMLAMSVFAFLWDTNKEFLQGYCIANGVIAAGNVPLILYETRTRHWQLAVMWIAIWTTFALLNFRAVGTVLPLTSAAVAFSLRVLMMRTKRLLK